MNDKTVMPPYPGLLKTLEAAQFEFTTLIPRLAPPYQRNAQIMAEWLRQAIDTEKSIQSAISGMERSHD